MALMSSSSGLMVPDDWITAVEYGFYEGWRHFRKFGENTDIDSGTEDIWRTGGVRTLPSSAAVAVVSSSSIADDGDPAGTGAQTLTIFGLDENWLEVSETVTLDGQSTVSTTQTFIRTDRGICASAGTGNVNAGTITCTVGGNTQWTIEPGEGQTLTGHFTVPADMYCIIRDVNVTSGRAGAQDIECSLQVRTQPSGSWRSIVQLQIYENSFEDAHMAPTLSPKTDVRWQATTAGSNLAVACQAQGDFIRKGWMDAQNNIYERPYNV